MKFVLTYDGELPSNGDYRKKWEIRKHFHPQLQELWQTHPSLHDMQYRRYVHQSGQMMMETHHTVAGPAMKRPPEDKMHEYRDVQGPILRGDREFLPIVRSDLALVCGLKIQFLRKEAPGRLIQEGDLDNRLKTLFDALSAPDQQQIVPDTTIEGPIYCLMENDALIAGVTIETQRLLTRPNSSIREVHLVIEVDVRVTQARYYNHPFLGD